MSTIENVFRHFWKPMEEIPLQYEGIDSGTSEEVKDFYKRLVEGMKKMQPNQFCTIRARSTHTGGIDLMVPEVFHKYIESLKESGLDIGKGDCEYGFKMPLAHGKRRELIIFRRHL